MCIRDRAESSTMTNGKVSTQAVRRASGSDADKASPSDATVVVSTEKELKQAVGSGKSTIYKMCIRDRERIEYLLHVVGMNKEHASRYPHEFSGGQRQRIGIARALAIDPEFIICDEPISALDVSIQAQVVNMLKDLQEERNLTYLFIAHDLSMVKHISDRVGVMYLGSMVELAEKEELYSHPLHPYTPALLSSIPIADPDESERAERIELNGDIPSPVNPPSGCKFCTRCPYATAVCREITPVLQDAGCLLYTSGCIGINNVLSVSYDILF